MSLSRSTSATAQFLDHLGHKRFLPHLVSQSCANPLGLRPHRCLPLIFARCAHRSLWVLLLFAFFVLYHTSREHMLHAIASSTSTSADNSSDLLFLLCFLSCTDTYMDKAFIDLCTHHCQLFFQPLFGNDLARTSSSLPCSFFLQTNFKAGLRWLFLHPLAASPFAICQSLILAENPFAVASFHMAASPVACQCLLLTASQL